MASEIRAGQRSDTLANRLGLGAWELGGDALGLPQNRVEVLCLHEFVGFQVLLHSLGLGCWVCSGPAGTSRVDGLGRAALVLGDDGAPSLRLAAERQVSS